jgi:hypothetical protein
MHDYSHACIPRDYFGVGDLMLASFATISGLGRIVVRDASILPRAQDSAQGLQPQPSNSHPLTTPTLILELFSSYWSSFPHTGALFLMLDLFSSPTCCALTRPHSVLSPPPPSPRLRVTTWSFNILISFLDVCRQVPDRYSRRLPCMCCNHAHLLPPRGPWAGGLHAYAFSPARRHLRSDSRDFLWQVSHLNPTG